MFRKVTYNEILRCQDYTNDDYWKEIIYNCACNNFPRGVKYDEVKNIIYIRYEYSGNIKNESFELPKNRKELYDLLLYIFKDLLGLRSPKDVDSSKNEIEDIRKNNEVELDCEWKNLKPKSVKNFIIMNYAIEMTYFYKLDFKYAKQLYNVIQLAFRFKKLVSDDIIYKNGKIKNIRGLEYNDKLNKFIITNEPKSIVKNEKTKNKQNIMHDYISKWLREYRSNYILRI